MLTYPLKVGCSDKIMRVTQKHLSTLKNNKAGACPQNLSSPAGVCGGSFKALVLIIVDKGGDGASGLTLHPLSRFPLCKSGHFNELQLSARGASHHFGSAARQ